jgi:rare lipoprotein A
VRSMATLVAAALAAGSITAHAHDGRKQGPTNHGRHSFAWNLHRQASVAHHGKASPVSVEQDVETRSLQPITDFFEKGLASIWSGGWTSDGKRVHPSDMACAHRTLPLGTVIHVTYERTKRSILVTVRDRGPYKRGRILDLTPGAASALGFDQHAGVARVMLNIAEPRRARASCPRLRCFLICRHLSASQAWRRPWRAS